MNTTPSPKASPDALTSGEALKKLTDEQHYEILQPVLSRYGMQRYLNGDEITLNPSDYRAIIDRALAITEATSTPSEQSGDALKPCEYVADWDRNERCYTCHCGDTSYGERMVTKCDSAIAHLTKYRPTVLAATEATSTPSGEIVLPEFVTRSIRDYADFREDVERLSDVGLSKAQAKIVRKAIYDTIDARVRNSVVAALAQRASAPDEAGHYHDALASAKHIYEGHYEALQCIDYIEAFVNARENFDG